MKTRHAAALVIWLMVPINGDPGTPIARWDQAGSFNTDEECRAALIRKLTEQFPHQSESDTEAAREFRRLSHASCVSPDDWFLLFPPLKVPMDNADPADRNAPLANWSRAGNYHSKEKCETALLKYRNDPPRREFHSKFLAKYIAQADAAARCAQDPGLKGKI
jgi:hypothetical protein